VKDILGYHARVNEIHERKVPRTDIDLNSGDVGIAAMIVYNFAWCFGNTHFENKIDPPFLAENNITL
jgi:hypothetical protein